MNMSIHSPQTLSSYVHVWRWPGNCMHDNAGFLSCAIIVILTRIACGMAELVITTSYLAPLVSRPLDSSAWSACQRSLLSRKPRGYMNVLSVFSLRFKSTQNWPSKFMAPQLRWAVWCLVIASALKIFDCHQSLDGSRCDRSPEALCLIKWCFLNSANASRTCIMTCIPPCFVT